MSEYLTFRMDGDTGKTKTHGVYSTLHGDKLGTVKWFGRWRQYAFFPEPGTIWNRDCLREVADFIEAGMLSRRKERGT